MKLRIAALVAGIPAIVAVVFVTALSLFQTPEPAFEETHSPIGPADTDAPATVRPGPRTAGTPADSPPATANSADLPAITTPQTEAGTGWIRGVVQELLDDPLPIAEAVLILRRQPEHAGRLRSPESPLPWTLAEPCWITRSDAEGEFTFVGLPEDATYCLAAQRDGYHFDNTEYLFDLLPGDDVRVFGVPIVELHVTLTNTDQWDLRDLVVTVEGDDMETLSLPASAQTMVIRCPYRNHLCVSYQPTTDETWELFPDPLPMFHPLLGDVRPIPPMPLTLELPVSITLELDIRVSEWGIHPASYSAKVLRVSEEAETYPRWQRWDNPAVETIWFEARNTLRMIALSYPGDFRIVVGTYVHIYSTIQVLEQPVTIRPGDRRVTVCLDLMGLQADQLLIVEADTSEIEPLPADSEILASVARSQNDQYPEPLYRVDHADGRTTFLLNREGLHLNRHTEIRFSLVADSQALARAIQVFPDNLVPRRIRIRLRRLYSFTVVVEESVSTPEWGTRVVVYGPGGSVTADLRDGRAGPFNDFGAGPITILVTHYRAQIPLAIRTFELRESGVCFTIRASETIAITVNVPPSYYTRHNARLLEVHYLDPLEHHWALRFRAFPTSALTASVPLAFAYENVCPGDYLIAVCSASTAYTMRVTIQAPGSVLFAHTETMPVSDFRAIPTGIRGLRS